MSTEYTGSDHANAIETARLAYVGAIRDNRTDAEIAILRAALKDAIRGAGGDPEKHLNSDASCSCGAVFTGSNSITEYARHVLRTGHGRPPVMLCDAPATRVLFDLVPARDVIAILIESHRATLIAAFAMRGLALDSQTIEELARELAKNAAQSLLQLEVTP